MIWAMFCDDCAYTNADGVCINRKSPYWRTDRLFKDGCCLFESNNCFDENVDSDFDDEY